jgi:3-deoxy-7-phosphoheptulonate synthase
MKRTGFDTVRDMVGALSPAGETSGYDLALGPCAIESEQQLAECAAAARDAGATYLRGGAIKLRTKAESFHGHGPTAFRWLGEIARDHGLKAVSEVTRAGDVDEAAIHLDALQIGARSMWNFELLEAAAQSGRLVVLKRGLGATTIDWLAAAARLQGYGADRVVMCERGNASADPASRNCVDISVLAFLVTETPLPIWLDASHTAGDPRVALALLQCARALGVAGAMAEIHPDPALATCDAEQAIAISALPGAGMTRAAVKFAAAANAL